MASSSKPHAAPKRRALATFNIGALPLDLLYEILLRLPAKLLCRLRTVCRLWRSILSDPRFAAVHAMRHPGPLIIAAVDEGLDVLVNIMDLSGQILKQVRVPGDSVVSTALDLVCVNKIGSSSSSYRCCNPFSGDVHYLPDQLLNLATGAVYQLPNSFAEQHEDLTSSLILYPRYLFGQVSCTGEYKVFRKLYHFFDPYQFGGRQLFEVCTVNGSNHTGWRAVAPLEKSIQFCKFSSVVINGVLYSQCLGPHRSITCDDRATEEDLIITFDLETEKWGLSMRGPPITFPDAAAEVFEDLPTVKQLTLANLNGSLAVVHGPAPSMDIWILMDPGKGLWVKQYIIQFEEYAKFQYVHPVVVLGDGRVVLYREYTRFLQIYDPRTNKLTDSGDACYSFEVALFGGNLLSL